MYMTELRAKIDQLCALFQKADEQELGYAAAFLRQRIYQPDSYVVLLGESCSGKSTIINSLIDQPVLPVSGVPSTGAVTEVFVNQEIEQFQYAVINTNATMELLDLEKFRFLSLHPDKNVKRLRLTVPSAKVEMPGSRIFDTPGYGSLLAEHEEVLLDFLPNCNAVIYVVSYRQGIQKDDHDFLRQMMELLQPDVPIYLVVNRCRPGVAKQDRRICEIIDAVSSFLGRTNLTVVLLPSIQSSEEEVVHIPQVAEFWEQIREGLYSEDRTMQVRSALTVQLNDLIAAARLELEMRHDRLKMTADESKICQEELNKFAERLQNAVDSIIRPGFAHIKMLLPKRLKYSRDIIEKNVCGAIEKEATASKDETFAYVQNHLLPFQTGRETANLQEFLRVELDELDKKVQNYLNEAVIQFERDIKLRFSSVTKAGVGFAKDLASKVLNAGLLKYFAKFGGAGGAGAGMANAASHLLKQIGDLFGVKFSLATHNGLKHFMKTVGLTSPKVLGGIAVGLIEVGALAVDYGTWKLRLTEKVKKGLDKWEVDLAELVGQDLDKLENENILAIQEIAEQCRRDARGFDSTEQSNDMEDIHAWIAELDEIEGEDYK